MWGKSKRVSKASQAFTSDLGLPQLMESAYKTAIKNLSQLLQKDTTDAKLAAQQLAVSKHWPKLLANLSLIETTVRRIQQERLNSPNEYTGDTKTVLELANGRIRMMEAEEQ